MGAERVLDSVPALLPLDVAFFRIQQRALHDHGHNGYTGTIAEADGFEDHTHVQLLSLGEAEDYIETHAEKWGPALALTVSCLGLGVQRYFGGIYSS